MVDRSQSMLAFLGVAADRRLLDEDRFNLPDAEQYREPVVSTHKHDRLVAAGSLLTGITLVGGAAMALYGGLQVLLNGGGAIDAVLAVVGLVLAATHWGWVHVAEYIGLTIDERDQQRDRRSRPALARGDRAVPPLQRLDQRARRRLDRRRTCAAPAGADRRSTRSRSSARRTPRRPTTRTPRRPSSRRPSRRCAARRGSRPTVSTDSGKPPRPPTRQRCSAPTTTGSDWRPNGPRQSRCPSTSTPRCWSHRWSNSRPQASTLPAGLICARLHALGSG